MLHRFAFPSGNDVLIVAVVKDEAPRLRAAEQSEELLTANPETSGRIHLRRSSGNQKQDRRRREG